MVISAIEKIKQASERERGYCGAGRGLQEMTADHADIQGGEF